MYWFKRKYRQIKRVIDFFPLIWNGYDFDYQYALELFKKQLERQAKFMESDKAIALDAKTNAQKIRTAIRLMDKVYDEDYAMEYLDTIDELYGKTYYDFMNFGEVSKREVWNENAVNEQHQKEIDEVRGDLLIHSLAKQKRAHKLLWDFIEQNIRRWWD